MLLNDSQRCGSAEHHDVTVKLIYYFLEVIHHYFIILSIQRSVAMATAVAEVLKSLGHKLQGGLLIDSNFKSDVFKKLN